MKTVFLLMMTFIFPHSLLAQNKPQMVILDTYPLKPGYDQNAIAQYLNENSKKIEVGVFEGIVKSAIQTLENSMRGTCAKEMETSISVTAEGKWAVVGVAVTGAMKLLILNPEMPKKCGK